MKPITINPQDKEKLKPLLVTLRGGYFDDLIAGQLDLEFCLGYHCHDRLSR